MAKERTPENPLKIVQVAEAVWPEQVGGSKRLITDLGKALEQRGHHVSLFVRNNEPAGRMDTIEGMPVFRYPVSRKGFLRSVFSEIWGAYTTLGRLCRVQQCDVVLAHHTVPGLGAALAERSRGFRLYTFLHIPACLEFGVEHEHLLSKGPHYRGAVRLYGRFLRWAQGVTCRKSEHVLCLSEFVKGLGQREFGLPEELLVKVPFGLDLDRFSPKPGSESFCRELDLPTQVNVLLTVRRLTPRMGIEKLLQAFKRVLSEGTEAVLLIAGEGPLKPVLEERIKKEGLQDRARLMGFVKEERLADLYRLSDLFIMPTAALEGFGVAAAEAMACGTPVLGTPVGAVPEMVSEMDPSLVCSGGDPESLARGILEALSNPERLVSWGKRARLLAEQRFDPERRTNAVEDLLSRGNKET